MSKAIIAYFAVMPGRIKGHKARLCTDDSVDTLSLFNLIDLNCLTPGERKIVSARIPPYLFKALQEMSGEADPFSAIGLENLNLTSAYIGPDVESVLARFPGKMGFNVSTIDGVVHKEYKLPRSKWSFE